jgi:enoyl reductase-like protein
MNTEIINTAQKISDVGAFYYILAFVGVTFGAIISMVMKSMNDNNKRFEHQSKLMEKLFLDSFEKIPKTLEVFQVEILKEFEKFNLQQANTWKGLNESIQELYTVILEDRVINSKNAKRIIKISMNNTIFEIFLELEDILNRNNITENLENIKNNISILFNTKVTNGRALLLQILKHESEMLKLIFEKTENIKKQGMEDIIIAFEEAVDNINEIQTYIDSKEGMSCEKHSTLEKRKAKIYIELRKKIKYYIERAKNDVENLIEGGVI